MAKSTIYWITFILVIIGALNWGLVGLFNFNLVSYLFSGSLYFIARTVYFIVGISALYLIFENIR